MPERASMRSNSGAERKNSSYWSSVQKPMTRSTPARLYQLRSNSTISPAAELGARQHALELRCGAEEFFVLVIRTKTHDALDTGAVVPAAVEQHDLACGRQMRNIALKIPLRTFAVVRRRQSGNTADAWIEALSNAFDDATLACRIAAFKQDHDLVAGGDHPILQLDQLGLQAEQFTEIQTAIRLVLLAAGIYAFGQLFDRAILDFQFQLFVIAVSQFTVDAAYQFFVVHFFSIWV